MIITRTNMGSRSIKLGPLKASIINHHRVKPLDYNIEAPFPVMTKHHSLPHLR
jgi:hypothetical protein